MPTLQNGLQLAAQHKGTTAAVLGGAALLTGAGVAVAYSRSKKRRKKSKRTYYKRHSTVKRRSRSKRGQRYPRTAGKAKDRSHKRIRFTRTGQPYIIQANGRAKFISKRSAKSSRKRKGGRY